MLKRIKSIFLVCILLFLDATCIKADAQEKELTLYSKAAVLMDAESGRVLYAKNAEENLPMASTTKIMTLIVTLENANLQDVVNVSAYAASMPDVQLNIRQGEQYYLKDLLYSMMLESHNDSAVAIAEHVSGDVEHFAELMNRKAEEIGCENTWFITPNGLDATQSIVNSKGETVELQHQTSASDLARIMSYCIMKSDKREQFLEITRTQQYRFSDLTGKRVHMCTNHNAFLNMMDGALTGKTGYTSKAGYCYVGAVRHDGATYVVALLACGWPNHKTYKWSDMRCLIKYGIDNFKCYDLSQIELPKENVRPLIVLGAKNDCVEHIQKVNVGYDTLPSGNVLIGIDEQITYKIERESITSAPVRANEKVGECTIYIGEEEWEKINIVTDSYVEENDIKNNVLLIIKRYFITY